VQAAPILCSGITVLKALKESGAKAGDWIAIPGAGGGLGHLAVQYACYMGLNVIAIDTGEEKKALCDKFGWVDAEMLLLFDARRSAAAFVDFKTAPDLVKAIQEATPDKLGPQASICTSSSGAAYEQAMGGSSETDSGVDPRGA
jgi:propanol-preferring alcohol dehydrogenase